MWQEYTDRGSGYCIEFRGNAFDHMPLRIQRVKYVNADYFEKVRAEVELIVNSSITAEGDLFEDIILISKLFAMATSVKDRAWEHEQEVRLVFSSMVNVAEFGDGWIPPIAMLHDGSMVYPSDPLIRDRLGSEIPYFSMPFGRFRSSSWYPNRAIAGVIIGPNNCRTIDDVSNDLANRGFQNVNVAKSDCAFRP